MLSLDELRNNTEAVKAAVAKKKFPGDIDSFIEVDKKRRALLSEFEGMRAKQNSQNEVMSALPKGSDAFKQAVAEMRGLSVRINKNI